ncbi:hypothetical protein NEOLEDRAFT_1225837 [Neolentinus lepideus HHB14362 ss-1]|uniref:NAD(P)-binding protein n=1 Tax=Neolentinus lepideus HHB14362 ss-1 TaxID=1314782 RepID=A0A165PFW0_9AGAM|nr:hypothetical protein NEOLEDRAFT_1225837 [Neolentinus lepideus HHB14362 ss-1]
MSLIIRLDVRDPATIASAVEVGVQKFVKIDLLLNNPGYGQNGIFELREREDPEQFNVDVFRVMDVTRALLPHFRGNGGGGMLRGRFLLSPYDIRILRQQIRSRRLDGRLPSYELASHNIFVKRIIPHGGVTSTNFGHSANAATPM